MKPSPLDDARAVLRRWFVVSGAVGTPSQLEQ